MTKLIPFLSLALLFSISVSCKKDNGQTTAEGLVVDATTQQPLPNARVQLLSSKRSLSNYGFILVDSVRADAAGKYRFSFQADEDYSYSLQAYAKKHIDKLSPISINNGKKNNKNLPLQPEGFLRINIVNVAPFDTIQNMPMVVTTLSPSPPVRYLFGL